MIDRLTAGGTFRDADDDLDAPFLYRMIVGFPNWLRTSTERYVSGTCGVLVRLYQAGGGDTFFFFEETLVPLRVSFGFSHWIQLTDLIRSGL